MSAADDYPTLARLGKTDHIAELAAGVEANLALAEIDRLREAVANQRNVLNYVLPSVAVGEGAILKVDGQWMIVTTKGPPNADSHG